MTATLSVILTHTYQVFHNIALNRNQSTGIHHTRRHTATLSVILTHAYQVVYSIPLGRNQSTGEPITQDDRQQPSV